MYVGEIAEIEKGENGFVAKLTTFLGTSYLKLPNEGIGFEVKQGDKIKIFSMEEDEYTIRHFEKSYIEYLLETDEDGINYTIYAIEKMGQEELSRKKVIIDEKKMDELPGEVRVKMIFFNKKMHKELTQLNTIAEEIIFSIQNHQTLEEIQQEYQTYKPVFQLSGVTEPYFVISLNGVKKTVLLNWNPQYHKNVLKENKMPLPLHLAEQELREIMAHELVASDILFAEEGAIVIIKGVKYIIATEKDRAKLKELNPLLYDKICKALVGKVIKDKEKLEQQRIREKLLKIVEEGEIEEEKNDLQDVLASKSIEDQVRRLLANEAEVPTYVFHLDDQEIRFYFGEDLEMSLNEFREKAKEIVEEKLAEYKEFYGWEDAEKMYERQFEQSKKLTLDSTLFDEEM
jgi:hypothetical protein